MLLAYLWECFFTIMYNWVSLYRDKDWPKIERKKKRGGGFSLSRKINTSPEKSSPLSQICLCLKKLWHVWEEAIWKYCEKRGKCRQPSFYPFAIMFSTLSRTETLATFDLSSAKYLDLVHSKILSFGKELRITVKTWNFLVKILVPFQL